MEELGQFALLPCSISGSLVLVLLSLLNYYWPFFLIFFYFVFVWRFIAGLAGRVILHWRIHSLIILFPYKNKNMYVSHPREDKYCSMWCFLKDELLD